MIFREGARGVLNHPWMAAAALLVAAVSLSLNLVLLYRLRSPEAIIAPIVADLTRDLIDEDGIIRHEVTLPAGTPLSLDIPVDERFAVAVDTVIPLNTTIEVPIRGPLGVARVPIPIRADIPVRTRLPLHIEHTFRIRTATSEPIVIPLQFRVNDLWPGLGAEP